MAPLTRLVPLRAQSVKAMVPWRQVSLRVVLATQEPPCRKPAIHRWRVEERDREIASMFYQHFQDKSAQHQRRSQRGIVLAMSKIKSRRKMCRAIVHFGLCAVRC